MRASGVTVYVTGLTPPRPQAGDLRADGDHDRRPRITPASPERRRDTAAGKVYDGTTDATLDTAGAMLTGTIYDMDDVVLDDSGAVVRVRIPGCGHRRHRSPSRG